MKAWPVDRGTGEDAPPPDLAEFARTAVAAGHGGLLTLAGRGTRPVAYVDDDGEPVIVCAEALSLRGSACLAVAATGRRRVVLAGRLLQPGRRDRHVMDLPSAHDLCLAEANRAGPMRLARLSVDAVRVEEDRAGVDVSCLAFATAEPDLWFAFAPAVAEHLNESHDDVLRSVAARHLRQADVVAVAVSRLRRTVLDLDVVTPLGAFRLHPPLRVALDDPRELCGRLPELLEPGPGWSVAR